MHSCYAVQAPGLVCPSAHAKQAAPCTPADRESAASTAARLPLQNSTSLPAADVVCVAMGSAAAMQGERKNSKEKSEIVKWGGAAIGAAAGNQEKKAGRTMRLCRLLTWCALLDMIFFEVSGIGAVSWSAQHRPPKLFVYVLPSHPCCPHAQFPHAALTHPPASASAAAHLVWPHWPLSWAGVCRLAELPTVAASLKPKPARTLMSASWKQMACERVVHGSCEGIWRMGKVVHGSHRRM